MENASGEIGEIPVEYYGKWGASEENLTTSVTFTNASINCTASADYDKYYYVVSSNTNSISADNLYFDKDNNKLIRGKLAGFKTTSNSTITCNYYMSGRCSQMGAFVEPFKSFFIGKYASHNSLVMYVSGQCIIKMRLILASDGRITDIDTTSTDCYTYVYKEGSLSGYVTLNGTYTVRESNANAVGGNLLDKPNITVPSNYVEVVSL